MRHAEVEEDTAFVEESPAFSENANLIGSFRKGFMSLTNHN